ncbi:MAG: 2-keto-4-pentenoate hydratase [Lautropia sp.]
MDPDDPLLDWLDAQLSGHAPWRDIMDLRPTFSDSDAYRLRTALVRRRCAGGDRLVGYKVAGSHLAVRQEEHVEGPIVGCMMASCVQDERTEVPYSAVRMAIEAEIGVLLKRDLRGPGLTLLDAWAAVAAVFPAFEILAFSDRPRPSHRARILASNFSGRYVFGGPLRAPHGLDLRAEGVSVSVNGRAVASGTGAEVLGNPLAALTLVANTMADSGEALRAGMIVMTGSLTPNVPVMPEDRIDAGFSRLGRIGVRFGRRS